MEDKQNVSGVKIFRHFIEEIPSETSNFDYFVLLDHFTNNKLNKNLIKSIFLERNKNIENKTNVNN